MDSGLLDADDDSSMMLTLSIPRQQPWTADAGDPK